MKEPLRMPRLAQVGVYVRDLDRTIERLENVFGIGPFLVMEGETEYCLYRGCETKARGRIAVGFSGRVQIELINIVEGANVYLDTLGGLDEGIHHLGFAVRDLEERLRACRDAGIEILQRGTLKQKGLTIDYAYLDTREQLGLVLEYIQTRFLGLPASQTPVMVNLLARMQRRFGFP